MALVLEHLDLLHAQVRLLQLPQLRRRVYPLHALARLFLYRSLHSRREHREALLRDKNVSVVDDRLVAVLLFLLVRDDLQRHVLTFQCRPPL